MRWVGSVDDEKVSIKDDLLQFSTLSSLGDAGTVSCQQAQKGKQVAGALVCSAVG